MVLLTFGTVALSAVSDSVGPGRVATWCLLGSAALLALVAAWPCAITVWATTVSSMLMGTAFVNLNAMVQHVGPRDGRVTANAAYRTAQQLGGVLVALVTPSPPAAVAAEGVADAFFYSPVFAGIACGLVLSAACVAAVPGPRHGSTLPSPTPRAAAGPAATPDNAASAPATAASAAVTAPSHVSKPEPAGWASVQARPWLFAWSALAMTIASLNSVVGTHFALLWTASLRGAAHGTTLLTAVAAVATVSAMFGVAAFERRARLGDRLAVLGLVLGGVLVALGVAPEQWTAGVAFVLQQLVIRVASMGIAMQTAQLAGQRATATMLAVQKAMSGVLNTFISSTHTSLLAHDVSLESLFVGNGLVILPASLALALAQARAEKERQATAPQRAKQD